MKKPHAIIVSFLLLGHLVLSLYAASHLSPTWDEISYPMSGYDQLTTGSVRLSPQNPFLSRLFFGIPFLFVKSAHDIQSQLSTLSDPTEAGYVFTFKQKLNPKTIVFLGRLPSILFSLLLALFIVGWGRRLWGEEGGIFLLVVYLAIPILISRSSLALVEMPMYFFLLLSAYFHEKWFETRNLRMLATTGFFMGLALLCKLAALPALFSFLLFELFYPTSPADPFVTRLKHASIIFVSAVGLAVFAYLPWDGGWLLFRKTLEAAFFFNKTVPYYFHGTFLEKAPGIFSLAAFFVKAPFFVLFLSGLGYYVWRKDGAATSVRDRFVFLLCTYLLLALVMGPPVSTIQLSPIYLAILFFCGGLTTLWKRGVRLEKMGLILLLLLSLWDANRNFPNQLAYFSPLAGGSNQGYRWLVDSDQDWGQSLPFLASYLKKKGNPPILLAHSSAGNPGAYGITYVDIFSPALVSHEHRDPDLVGMKLPRLMVISTKVLQAYPEAMAWPLENLKPIAEVASCYFVYDISGQAEARKWLAQIFEATRRPALAREVLEGESTKRF